MIERHFINFIEIPASPGAKTMRWQVVTKDHQTVLGIIKWFGAWRCYAFFPNEKTIYEYKCLRDIAQFTVDQTVVHRSK